MSTNIVGQKNESKSSKPNSSGMEDIGVFEFVNFYCY